MIKIEKGMKGSLLSPDININECVSEYLHSGNLFPWRLN